MEDFKKTKNTLVVITTFNREELFWRLYNSIDAKKVDVLIVQDAAKEYPYEGSFDNINIIKVDDRKGIGNSKYIGTEHAKEHGYENLFLVEDDVEVLDNNVWDVFISFSNWTGIGHTNWNTAAFNKFRFSFPVHEDFTGDVHLHAQGAFQYFHKSTFDKFKWDTHYINALEHGDVEYQLHLANEAPPLGSAVSPSNCENYLKYDDGESVSFVLDDHEQNRKNAFEYWHSKWGVDLADIRPVSNDMVKRWIYLSQKRKGTLPDEPYKFETINPVSIVCTIKDRCLLKYTSNDQLLPNELLDMKNHDLVITKMLNANNGRGGIMLNHQLMYNPEGFRPFDQFLKSINEQAHRYEGDVELIVVDWSSIDDNVLDVVDYLWDHKSKVITLPHNEVFSRGYALNKAIEEASHEHIHISDVDMVYGSPRFLEEAGKLDGEAIFPIIAKEQSPSSLCLYMECSGFGVASMEKSTFDKAGGFDDIRKWGGEDNNLFDAVDKVLGKQNVKRTMYREVIHQWHTDKNRIT